MPWSCSSQYEEKQVLRCCSGSSQYHRLRPHARCLRPQEKDAAAETGGRLTVKAVFENMPSAFQANKAAGVDAVFQYKISGAGGGNWYVAVNFIRTCLKNKIRVLGKAWIGGKAEHTRSI